jgi:hypothetical protein
MSYQLQIREDKLVYVIEIFGFTLRKRTLLVSDLEKLTVIHLGQRTILLVNLKKGFRIKLQRFRPEGLTDEMIEFAQAHNIKVVKTGNI